MYDILSVTAKICQYVIHMFVWCMYF